MSNVLSKFSPLYGSPYVDTMICMDKDKGVVDANLTKVLLDCLGVLDAIGLSEYYIPCGFSQWRASRFIPPLDVYVRVSDLYSVWSEDTSLNIVEPPRYDRVCVLDPLLHSNRYALNSCWSVGPVLNSWLEEYLYEGIELLGL